MLHQIAPWAETPSFRAGMRIGGIRDLRSLTEQNRGHVNTRATPDGQPDYMGAWLSGKGLLDRWNANAALANNEWRGIRVPEAATLAGRS